MSILNGLRKVFTPTPPVPILPSGTPTEVQQQDILKNYRKFQGEIEQYKKPHDYEKYPQYFRDIRFKQYEEFRQCIAHLVKRLVGHEAFKQKLLEVDTSIFSDLLDQKEHIKYLVKTCPIVVKDLPVFLQEDPEIAEVILQHHVGMVKFLPLKFRNDPEFMYRCLADESKFARVGFFPAKYNPQEVFKAIGPELGAQLDKSDQSKIATQLKAIADIQINATELSKNYQRDSQQQQGRTCRFN